MPRSGVHDVSDILVQAAEDVSTMPIANCAPQPDESDEFFSFAIYTASIDMPRGFSVRLEVFRYLKDNRASMKRLHNYPAAKRVFTRYNANLSSSAPVERLFSLASLIFCPNKRRRINDMFFEKFYCKCLKLFVFIKVSVGNADFLFLNCDDCLL